MKEPWLQRQIRNHRWFVENSRTHIGVYTFTDYLYYPIAWAKFMWWSRHD